MPTSDQLRAWRLRADLIDLAVTRDDAEATFEELRRDKHQNPVILQRAQIAAGEAQASLDDALGELADLASKDRPPSEPNPLGQPRYILDLEFANPDPQAGFDPAHVAWGGDSQTAFIGGAFLSVDAKIEWKQVAPPHDTDFEDANLVGAAGWALAVEYSHADVPFDHPFGFDWEFMFALDPDYTFLLSSANDVDEVEIARAVAQAGPRRIPAPLGPLGFSLLGVETDAGLVPKQFRDPLYGGVFDGDRVAVVGRWIVDCGHEVTLGDQSASYRTEIHPPLLIADGFVTNIGLAERTLDRPRTRVHFASRPYLVGQHFCVDPAHAYEDETDDDGTMWDHMASELAKVASIQSFQVEGHPKIKSLPFRGRPQARFVVRPPAPDNPLINPGELWTAWQFTVRTGCSVEVGAGAAGSVVVTVTLDDQTYVPPRLPPRHERTYSRDELDALSPGSGGKLLKAEVVAALLSISPVEAAAVLSKDFLTDEYDSLEQSVDLFDTTRGVEALVSDLPVAGGVSVDDVQPFPVYGWIEVGYRPLQAHL
jgi:hypothetical protein